MDTPAVWMVVVCFLSCSLTSPSQSDPTAPASASRASESGFDSEGRQTFYTSDLYRQALFLAGDTVFTDYEVLNSYTLLGPGVVQGKQVTAIYLDPRQPRFFEADGRAVAAYGYDLQMWRTPLAETASVFLRAKACVETPKGFTQCM